MLGMFILVEDVTEIKFGNDQSTPLIRLECQPLLTADDDEDRKGPASADTTICHFGSLH
jgi:hypothetical protein